MDPVGALKVPNAWKPAIREKWNTLPPELRQNPAMLGFVEEATRREKEHELATREAMPAKKFHEDFHRAVSPFIPILRAEGVSDPMQAVSATLNLLSVMRMGTPQQKAQTVAKFVQQYDVDIQALDGALSSPQAPQSQPQQGQQFRDPRLDQLLGHLQTQQQQRTQQTLSQQRAEAAAFAEDPANAFFEDVREDMADRIDALEKRGIKWSMKDVYDQSVWARPELRDIMQKRQAAEAAKAQTASTQQARNAAVSVKSTPSTGASNPTEPKTYRDMVAAAYDATIGQR